MSLLSAAGLRLEDIADIVGHASIRMTAEVYRHHPVEPTITAAKPPRNASRKAPNRRHQPHQEAPKWT